MLTSANARENWGVGGADNFCLYRIGIYAHIAYWDHNGLRQSTGERALLNGKNFPQ